jgi:hypothetical protein
MIRKRRVASLQNVRRFALRHQRRVDALIIRGTLN